MNINKPEGFASWVDALLYTIRRENDKMGIYYSFQKQFIENDFFSPSAGRIYYDTVWGCIY